MKTLTYLILLIGCVTLVLSGCSPKKKLKNVTSVLHMDSVAQANSSGSSEDTTALKTIDRPAFELPHIFRSRTEKVLETQGYKMMSCCDCTRGGGGCCACPPEPEESSALQFAAPSVYKQATLVPVTAGKTNITLKPEESDEVTIFTLDQQPENGNYEFRLIGDRTMSIPVTIEDGTMRVNSNQ